MKQNAQLTELSHKLGDLIHNWGFKRIHGRIWTRLFLSTRPLDAADLIQQLDISKALVSISLRELLDVKAVEDVGRSARGTNLFRANGNLQAIYLEVLKKRERMMLEQTSAALSMVAALEAVDLNESDISSTQISVLGSHLEKAMTVLNAYVSREDASAVSIMASNADTVVSFPSPRGNDFEARSVSASAQEF